MDQNTAKGAYLKEEINEINCSQAFLGSSPQVNLANGGLRYALDGVSVGYGNYAIDVGLIYNSKLNETFAKKITGFGRNWKLNLTQIILFDNCDAEGRKIYKYLDSAGDVHRFIEFDTNRYYDERNAKVVLTQSNEGYVLTDGVGNELRFDAEGFLAESVSCQNKSMIKLYEYENGRLTRVYDRRTAIDGRAKSRIELYYNAQGNLSEIISFVNFKTKLCGVKYEYDKYGNLISVLKTAYNRMGDEALSRDILSFRYNTLGELVFIEDMQSEQAVKVQYEDERVQKLSTGTQKKTYVPLGAEDKEGNPLLRCGTAELGMPLKIAFIEKSYQQFCYDSLENANSLSFKTDITNENGITLTYFLDRLTSITSSFENVNGELKTLSKQGAKGTDRTCEGSVIINGCPCESQRGEKTILSSALFDVARNKAEKSCLRFGYSFWLKLSGSYNVAEMELNYKFKHGDSSTSRVYVDSFAEKAWQRVTIPLVAPKNADDEKEVSPLEELSVKLIANKNACADEYEFNEIGFAPMPQSELMLAGPYEINVPFSKCGNVRYGFLDGSYNFQTAETDTSGDFFFTENDVIASFTSEHARGYYKIGKKLFDVICCNGTKRIANVSSLRFSDSEGAYSVSSNVPFASQTVSSDGETVITEKYEFNSASLTVTTVGKRKETVSSASLKTDYTGKKISETDEYGVISEFFYNKYGDLEEATVTGSDGILAARETYFYDSEGRLISANNGLKGKKISYNEFDQIDSVKETNAFNAEIGRKSCTDYGVFRNRVRRVKEYDGENKTTEKNVSYENGRLRTVSDGTMKYGILYDAESNETEYTAFIDGWEKPVKNDSVSNFRVNDEDILSQAHTSVLFDKSGSESESLTTEIDAYGRTVQLLRTRGANGRFDYGYEDSIPESKFASKPQRCENYQKKEYTRYDYDPEGNLVGWNERQYDVLNGSKNLFSVKQVSDNAAKYTFGESEDYFAAAEYDVDKVLSPKVTATKYSFDANADFDVTHPLAWFTQNYSYDELGRVKQKYNENYSRYVYTYQTKGSASLVETAEFKNYEDDAHFQYALPLIHQAEKYDYTDKAQIKKVNNVFSWQQHDSSGKNKEIEFDETKSYTYDGMNRLTSEQTVLSQINGMYFGTHTTQKNYSYNDSGKISKVTQNDGKTFTYEYADGKLKKITNGTETVKYFTYDFYGNRESQDYSGAVTKYGYVYGNTLNRVENQNGTAIYEYDANGVRCAKKIGNETTRFFLDGSKLLGENRTYTDSTPEKEIRYFYDADGLVGFKYRNEYFLYVRDAQNNITAIIRRDTRLAARYVYDSWGNCTVLNESGEVDKNIVSIGNINPFRWKSFYYDTESNLYYANGSYYDPETGLYVDSSPIESVTENALTPLAIDRNGILCDNILELAASPYTVFPITKLFSDDTYEESNNDGIPTWTRILLGVGAIIMGGIVTVITGGWGALPYYGAVVATGGVVGAGFEIGKQVIFDGNIHDLNAIAWSAFGGAASTGLVYIAHGYGTAFFLGGTGSVISGLITGNINDLNTANIYFSLGGGLNILGRFIGIKVANKISKLIADRADNIVANSPFVAMLGDTLEDFIGASFNPIMNSQVSWFQSVLNLSRGDFMNSFLYILLSELLSSIISGWL